MGSQRKITDPDEREAFLGLWAIPGIGTVTLRDLESQVGGSVKALVDVPVREWIALSPIRDLPREWLREISTLRALAERIREMCLATRTELAFPGEPGYPRRLQDLSEAPAVVFFQGEPGVERRRVAMVGSRSADPASRSFARTLAAEVAQVGIGVVSGAAAGIDRCSHEGALVVRGETWAWIACSIDQIDTAQKKLKAQILDAGGRVLTEYPPNTRSRKEYFPRRNRLISGSADAVVVVRAEPDSGSLRTAEHALRQGRPLLMVPSDPFSGVNAGGNQWLAEGKARVCLGAREVFEALSVVPQRMAEPPTPGRPVEELDLSGNARATLSVLSRRRQLFEEILGATRLGPTELVSALSELELSGLAVQHPGKVYERV